MNICFDLDGPIIDVSDRYYRAFLESLRGIDVNKSQILNKEDFWILKQNRVTDFELGLMCGMTTKEAKVSADKRRLLTFKEEYLYLDKIFEDVNNVLNQLKSHGIPIFIVTLRKKSQLAFAVKQFKLNKYFSDNQLFSLGESQNGDFQGDIQEKYTLLFQAIQQLSLNPRETILIGDSETDIHSGRLAKYGEVVGITRGIRSREQLSILKPNFLVDSLVEALNLISQRV